MGRGAILGGVPLISRADGRPPPGDARLAGEFQFEVSGYVGHEEEVLRLRNANRSVAQLRDYLDWRYHTLPGLPKPRIAWLRDVSGQAVGVAAAIYRRFWIDGVAAPVAVLGDISLDAHLRGRGLGRRLLIAVSRELEKSEHGLKGFVIPTEAAARSLTSIGWRSAGRMVSHVCLVNPAVWLRLRPGGAGFATALAALPRSLLAFAARLQRCDEWSLELCEDFDRRFDALWSALPKAGRILSDRSCSTLRWRYRDHPSRRFRVACFLRSGQLMGYLVFEMSADASDLSIQDFVLAEPTGLPEVLSLFVTWCLGQQRIGTVRMSLSEGHPHAVSLWRLGFVAREPQGRFHVLDTLSGKARGSSMWCLTAGDKDI